MGNAESSEKERTSSSSKKSRRSGKSDGDVASRAQKAVGEFSANLQNGFKRLEENDHPAAQLVDSICGPYLDADHNSNKYGASSFYSEDVSEDGSMSRNTISEDETTTTTDYRRRVKDEQSVDTMSYMSQSDYSESIAAEKRKAKRSSSYESEDEARAPLVPAPIPSLHKPLASSFAKRCYFTKSGIGKTTQHYEGLTLTGNVVLMLASAMKLKGCPTICDEDLRRVEQTYPNQFSRLPDELLLSSGWRRISKYCHFSNKPVPDGIPFFHSKQRLHTSGGYYFLLAAAVGMVRPIDVEPLSRDTLVLLETDYPVTCDQAPDVLIQDPEQWTLVDKFCFFSGGPINTDEDVYYQADFDGNPIYMLAFLSPSLTPAELYKLDNGDLKSVSAVEEVESVYDLTERDFDDLKLYHLGPCRALPQYILQPQAWTKVLPPHFLAAREKALKRAREFEGDIDESDVSETATVERQQHLSVGSARQGYAPPGNGAHKPAVQQPGTALSSPFAPLKKDPSVEQPGFDEEPRAESDYASESDDGGMADEEDYLHEEEETYMDQSLPMDEAMANQAARGPPRLDPPEDEPPSLSKREVNGISSAYGLHTSGISDQEPSFDQSFDQRSVDEPTASYDGGDYYESSPDKVTEKDYYPGNALAYEQQIAGFDLEDSFSPGSETISEHQQFFGHASTGPSTDLDDNLQPSPERPRDRKKQLPPTSPKSMQGSEFTQSSAMRGAQELIRRNRQKRLELARKRELQDKLSTSQTEDTEDRPLTSPRTESESVTWESASEITSVASGASSAWTEGSNIPDRSSRRALILQMAKARMKSHKPSEALDMDDMDDNYSEEKKLEADARDTTTDIDLMEDLD